MENKVVFNQILLQDLDRKYKCLDEFCEFYGWSSYKSDDKFNYILKDDQTGELEYFAWFGALLIRISGRALDYEINEHEIEDEATTMDYFNYLTNLLWVYMANTDKLDDKWLRNIMNDIGKLNIESEED